MRVARLRSSDRQRVEGREEPTIRAAHPDDRNPRPGGLARPLLFAAGLAALGAAPFALLARWVRHAPPEGAPAETIEAPPRSEAARLRARLAIAAPTGAPAPHRPADLDALLGALAEAPPSGADDQQRRHARASFAAHLDGEGRSALEGSVDRFVSAMQEIATQLADPAITDQGDESRDSRQEIVENAMTAFRRAVEELDGLGGDTPAGPLLIAQLAPDTRARLQRLGRFSP